MVGRKVASVTLVFTRITHLHYNMNTIYFITSLVVTLVGTGVICHYVSSLFRSFTLARNGAFRASRFRVDADSYECDYRDPIEQEDADVILEDEIEDGEAVRGIDAAKVPRGPAMRRIARRQKAVHVDRAGHAISEKYYGSIVADARCSYAAGGYTEYNAELARSYMVRIMRKHGVRPSHIDARLEHMVNAVFATSRAHQIARQEREAMLNPLMRWYCDHMRPGKSK